MKGFHSTRQKYKNSGRRKYPMGKDKRNGNRIRYKIGRRSRTKGAGGLRAAKCLSVGVGTLATWGMIALSSYKNRRNRGNLMANGDRAQKGKKCQEGRKGKSEMTSEVRFSLLRGWWSDWRRIFRGAGCWQCRRKSRGLSESWCFNAGGFLGRTAWKRPKCERRRAHCSRIIDPGYNGGVCILNWLGKYILDIWGA